MTSEQEQRMGAEKMQIGGARAGGCGGAAVRAQEEVAAQATGAAQAAGGAQAEESAQAGSCCAGSGMDRRSVFRAAGTVGIAAAAGGLAACSSGDEASYADQFASAEPVTVAAADVEVGSGLVVDQTYVVVQPRAGEFFAYSSVCPHQGCQVRQITPESITCPCHNSIFSVEDGSVLQGPAESGLPQADVAADGDTLTLTPGAA